MSNSNKKVVIIDYQLGNLFSVKQACDTVGIDSKISSEKSDILNADALILPGVGAFIEAMKNLNKLDISLVFIQNFFSSSSSSKENELWGVAPEDRLLRVHWCSLEHFSRWSVAPECLFLFWSRWCMRAWHSWTFEKLHQMS